MPSSVVCVHFCVDVSQLRADVSTGAPRAEGTPWRVSTLDEHALEAALALRELHGGTVKALSLVSAEPPRELLLGVLAMGVDELQLVLDESAGEADALATATVLATALAGPGRPDLVFFGEGSIDRFDQQVGPRVAQELGLASLTHVVRLELVGGRLEADRLLEDRVETVRCGLPAVVTLGQESPAPRLPSVLQILGASRKPVGTRRIGELAALGGQSCASLAGTRTLSVVAPRTERRGTKVEGDGPDEIAGRLVKQLLAEGVIKP